MHLLLTVLEYIKKLKTTRYDGVVLDINIPLAWNGLQLLEQLQKDKNPCSSHHGKYDINKDADVTIQAMEGGRAVDFVTKPTNVIEAKGEGVQKQLLQRALGGMR